MEIRYAICCGLDVHTGSVTACLRWRQLNSWATAILVILAATGSGWLSSFPIAPQAPRRRALTMSGVSMAAVSTMVRTGVGEVPRPPSLRGPNDPYRLRRLALNSGDPPSRRGSHGSGPVLERIPSVEARDCW